MIFTKPMTDTTTLLLGVEYVRFDLDMSGMQTALHVDTRGLLANVGLRIYLDR